MIKPKDAAWIACMASTLAGEMERLDKMVFHYPQILNSAGTLRLCLDNARRELAQHVAEAEAAKGDAP
ncbi:MAG: hypothetical protein ACRYGR_09935 [Janthinobacterium lividum]